MHAGLVGQKRTRPRHSHQGLDVKKLFKGRCFDDVLEAELARSLCMWHDYGDRVEGMLLHMPREMREVVEYQLKKKVGDPNHPMLGLIAEFVQMAEAHTRNVTRIGELRRRADKQMNDRVKALSDIQLDDEIKGLIQQLTRSEYGALGVDIERTKSEQN